MQLSRDQRALLQNLNVASAAALALTALNYSEYHTLIKGLRHILVRDWDLWNLFFFNFQPFPWHWKTNFSFFQLYDRIGSQGQTGGNRPRTDVAAGLLVDVSNVYMCVCVCVCVCLSVWGYSDLIEYSLCE
jgi:hypothetical protein